MQEGFLGTHSQLGYVVTDLEKAMKFWCEVMGVGPFIVLESSPLPERVTNRGQVVSPRLRLAFAYQGETQIELIEQVNDEQSIYKDFIDAGREGLHHIAFWVDDLPKASARLQDGGIELVSEMRFASGTPSVIYFKGGSDADVLIELVQRTDLREASFSAMKRLAATWDAKQDPYRYFATMQDFLDIAK